MALGSGGLVNQTLRGFFSYAHEDRAVAEKLFADLEQRDVRLWFDQRDFPPGPEDGFAAYLDSQILNAIRESYFFVILLTPKSVSKEGYIRKEVRQALAMIRELGLERSFIIPVRAAPCTPSPEELDGLGHFVDLFPDWSAGVTQVRALLPANPACPDIATATPLEIQANLATLAYLRTTAAALAERSTLSVFLDNCLRRLRGIAPAVRSRKIEKIERGIDAFTACLQLHFTVGCGSLDPLATCRECSAKGTIIHGTVQIGGYSQSDYNDNYIVWCTACYWASYDFEIDYHGTGPLAFDYDTNSYR